MLICMRWRLGCHGGEQALEQALGGSDHLCRRLVGLLITDQICRLLIEVDPGNGLLGGLDFGEHRLRRLRGYLRFLTAASDIRHQSAIIIAECLSRQKALIGEVGERDNVAIAARPTRGQGEAIAGRGCPC